MIVEVSPNSGLPNMYNNMNNIGAGNPIILFLVTIILILYYFLFSSLGEGAAAPMPQESSPAIVFMEVLLWAMFLILLLLNGLRYFFEIDLVASVDNLLTDKPEVNVEITMPEESSEVPEIKESPQVFYVPDNKYDYNDAQAICKAYGGSLATYDQIEDAYNKGAEWCGYGWSNGQMALYPTQKETWNNLQKIPSHAHDCGRPGINGGYIANPNVKFGVNCYGFKPKMTKDEQEKMNERSIYPKTQAELNFEKQVKYWKQQLPKILVAPFNYDTWSKI